ncbi:MAG: winged helix-turn-helix domain-containing protein [Janthinobacterium lividum]
MPATSRHNIVSFGIYEVDLDAGEIRKAGLRVRLPGQPFRLLVALLSRPGEVLTREELQHEIWGTNTNVDFERGIASTVNKLREALGDSAEQPRYVETLARKGYRFIAPVTAVSGPVLEEDHPAAQSSVSGVVLPDSTSAVEAPGPPLSTTMPAETEVPSFLPARDAVEELAAETELRRRTGLSLQVQQGVLWLMATVSLLLLTALLTWRWAQTGAVAAPPHIEQLTQTNDISPGPPNPETLLSIVTDGPRLYVPVVVNGRSQLSSVAVGSTEIQPISMPEDLSSGAITAISHDGSKLLIRSLQTREPEQPLWIVPTTGSEALRVGEVLAHDATWMPSEEERILVASGNDLDVVQLGTGEVSPYVTLPGRAFWLRWAPDGNTLRFTLFDPVNHSSSLWELDATTRKAHPLSFPHLRNVSLCCGSWTARGDVYVFQASDAHTSNLWMARTSTRAQPEQLTNGPMRFSSPLPSREGRVMFAFGEVQPGGTRRYDRLLHQFVPASHFLENAQRISYSRDGAWVAWTDPQGRLWRARSKDGADLLRLTGDNLEVFHARWSPNGQQLLLMARQPGETWQVFTVSATGSAIRRLLNDGRNLADPDWSPDGNQIVFGREADLMGQENGPHDIQVLDLRTHQISPVPGSTNLFSPRWSPDGEWIAALSRDQARLLIYNLRDRSWRTVFSDGAADPVWSADSHAVYFHAFAQPNSAIMRAGIDGTVDTTADLSRLGLPTADTYFFSGVTPDGSPLIEPRVGIGNLYSIDLPQ